MIDPSKPLKNARHERFAQLVASGLKLVDAFAEVGMEGNRRHASALGQKKDISARVEWIKEQSAQGTILSRREALEVLCHVAKHGDSGGARVSAVAQAAKMEGWDKPEKVEAVLEVRIMKL
jgi:hypothetical protein